MDPLGPIPSPSTTPEIRVQGVEIPSLSVSEEMMNMNTDKLTTIAGGVAVVCTGVLGSGLIVAGTAIYTATVAIGTVSGLVFAFFTNKPNPFQNPNKKP